MNVYLNICQSNLPHSSQLNTKTLLDGKIFFIKVMKPRDNVNEEHMVQRERIRKNVQTAVHIFSKQLNVFLHQVQYHIAV